MRHSRRAWRRAAILATAAAVLSGLGVVAPGAAMAVPAPVVPTGLAPSTLATPVKNLELRWAPVPGATAYEVRLFAGDSDPENEAATVTSYATPVNRWVAPVSLPRDEYFWQVRARVGSATGRWSQTARFSRGWADAPSRPATTPHVDGSPLPTFSWTEVPDASFYEVEISDYPFDVSRSVQTGTNRSWTYFTAHTTFSPYAVAAGPEYDVAPGTSTGAVAVDSAGDATQSSIGTKFTIGKRYYWRVRGRDGSVDTATTPFRAPALGCTGVWSESDNVISDNGTPGDLSDDTVTVPLPAKAPTYVRTPECSQWVVGQTFVPTVTTLSWDRPPAPDGLAVAPALGGGSSSAADVTVTDSPVFSWTAVPGAVKYRVTLSRTADLNDADVVWETESTTLTPVSSLPLGDAGAYWGVQACTGNRLCSLTGPVRHVRKVPATSVAPVSLSQDAGSVVAVWTTQNQGSAPAPRASANHYRVQLLDASGSPVPVHGSDSVLTDRIADPARPGTSHWSVPASDLAEGTYRFRVRGIDVTGRSLPWSAISGTTVIDHAAPTVRLTSGSGVAGRTSVTLTFSEPVTGVSSGTVGVAAGATRVPGTVTITSDTTARFVPASAWLTGAYLSAWSSGQAVDRARKPVTATTTALRTSTTADSSGTALTYVTGDRVWSTRTASSAYGKSYRSTKDDARTSRRAYVATTVYGTSLTVGTCKSPTSGSLQVWVDGKLRTTAILYRSYTGCGVTVSLKGLTAARHAVKLVAVANGSRGDAAVDRITVS